MPEPHRKKKPTQYPKKFRMKLEKIKAEREMRENPDDTIGRITDTLVHELVPPGSVAVMHSVLDEVAFRITTTFQYDVEETEYLCVRPPWLPPLAAE